MQKFDGIITLSVSRQFSDIEAAITFLEETKSRVKNYVNAVFLLKIGQAEKRLNLG